MEVDLSAAVYMEFDDACRTMGMNYDELIEFAIIKLFMDKSNFVICSHCQSYLGLAVAKENGEQMQRCTCRLARQKLPT